MLFLKRICSIFILYCFVFPLGVCTLFAQAGTDDGLLFDLLSERPNWFSSILENPEKYEVQILYTQIDRDENNQPSFRSFSYRVDRFKYFYPASTMKLPIALMAMEKINNLNIDNLNIYSRLEIDSAYDGQTKVLYDSTSESNNASIAHYIKKLLLVSDNDANNRLYEFVGQKELNKGLFNKGFKDLRLVHRLSYPMTVEQNRHTNPFRFFDDKNELIHSQKAAYSDLDLTLPHPVLKGKGYSIRDSIIDEPKDFSASNFISIENLQNILKAVIFHDYSPKNHTFNLSNSDRQFLLQYLSQLPSETVFPTYSLPKYYDSYVKFFMFGDSKEAMPKNIRIFNKVGLANGYFEDNAYIVDFDAKIEFFLTAVIYVNDNQLFDGKYEYKEIAFPFMSRIGTMIYEYELKRNRSHYPDLSEFMVDYDK